MRDINTAIAVLFLCLSLFTSGCGNSRVIAPVDDRTISEDISKLPQSQSNADLPLETEEQGLIENSSELIESEVEKPDAVVLAMINKAELQMADGQIYDAIASLERGARLKPKDPWLWHSLAVLRLQNEEWEEAISLAEKSISLAAGNRPLLSGNWQVIVDAKAALGDKAGVIEAQKKLRQYQQTLTS